MGDLCIVGLLFEADEGLAPSLCGRRLAHSQGDLQRQSAIFFEIGLNVPETKCLEHTTAFWRVLSGSLRPRIALTHSSLRLCLRGSTWPFVSSVGRLKKNVFVGFFVNFDLQPGTEQYFILCC